MPDTVRIFISYARKDARELAIRLRDTLQSKGFSVWLDLDAIGGGADWMRNIEEAIEQCDVTLALLSPGSNASSWCRAEQLRALRKGKRIIPLLAVAHTDPPLHLEHLNYLDFTQAANYDSAFSDLVSDISAGQAFEQHSVGSGNGQGSGNTVYKEPPTHDQARGDIEEKRSAPAFRRQLKQLQAEPWLGARHWWPYFLFQYVDLHAAVDILKNGEMLSPKLAGAQQHSYWDSFVRLYFRPRTPDLFNSEGFWPNSKPVRPEHARRYTPIPVYLLFDMEEILAHPDSRFSAGNPEKTNQTYTTPDYFAELPFEQIYHDAPFNADQRDEIMRSREAQVVIPDRLTLEGLQFIWLRSPAEYETLRYLLPAEVWARWRNKITTRSDYHLFNHRRPYVQQALLQSHQLTLHFNPCYKAEDCGPYFAQIVIEHADGNQTTWQDEALGTHQPLTIPFAGQVAGSGGYSVQLLLDGDLAYAGRYAPELVLL